jgi:hypothetical protein
MRRGCRRLELAGCMLGISFAAACSDGVTGVTGGAPKVVDSAYVVTGQSVLALVHGLAAAPASGVVVGISTPPRHGTAEAAGDTVRYLPTAGFVGADTVALYVRDPHTGLRTEYVRFMVVPGPYTVTELGNQGVLLRVNGLNDAGQLAVRVTLPDGTRHAARWQNGSYTVFDNPPGVTESDAVAINDLGDVAGHLDGRPVVWHAGSTTPTYVLADSQELRAPVDINDRGDVLLAGGLISGDPGKIVVNGTVTVLGGRIGGCFRTIRLNNSGTVLAEQCEELYPNWSVFPSGNYGGCFGGRFSSATDMNDAGTVVGSAENGSSSGKTNLCEWPLDRTGVELHTAFGSWVVDASRISKRGWMLGSVTVAGQTQPALFANGIAIPASVLLPDPQYQLRTGVAINANGQILGLATKGGGTQLVPVLLTPASGGTGP